MAIIVPDGCVRFLCYFVVKCTAAIFLWRITLACVCLSDMISVQHLKKTKNLPDNPSYARS